MTDLAERIDRLESRFAVTDLAYAYARFIRRDEPENVSQLFLPDGTFEVRDGHPDRPEFKVRGTYEGRQAVHDHLAPNKGKPHPVPLIRNVIVEVDGDTATLNCVMDATIYGTEHRVQGEYRDTCQRVDGRWFFKSRVYTIYSGASSI